MKTIKLITALSGAIVMIAFNVLMLFLIVWLFNHFSTFLQHFASGGY